MKIFSDKPPWYVAGLAFECIRCGRCCAGPEEGYVWVTEHQVRQIAEHLGLPVQEVRREYVRRVGQRLSLVENRKSRDCIFLRYDDQGRSQCLIYPVRPVQCRTWPFWPGNLRSPRTWLSASERCPGINRGPLHEIDEIQARREKTRG
jgi:hypothetical protein